MTIDLSGLPIDLKDSIEISLSLGIGYIVRELRQKIPFGPLARAINKVKGSQAFALAKVLAEAAADEELSEAESDSIAEFVTRQLGIDMKTQDLAKAQGSKKVARAIVDNDLLA